MKAKSIVDEMEEGRKEEGIEFNVFFTVESIFGTVCVRGGAVGECVPENWTCCFEREK